MARDVIDDRLIGALHVRALTRSGLLHEVAQEHRVVQTGTIAALMDGHYDGDLRVGELLARAHLGIGTYPPLREVVAHQTEWTVPEASGTVVGFRFPDASSGIEVPGSHLHFLSHDRTNGGHVLGLTLVAGDLAVDGEHELHVEVPAGIELGEPGALASEIHAVEGSAG